MTGLDAGEATLRVRRVVRRLAFELFWLRAEQIALRELRGRDHVGVDFFKLAHTGIQSDWLLRLVRILDQRDVASLWYLHRTLLRAVEQALARTAVSISEIQSLSDRIKLIRDKVFVHIDKAGVFTPDAFYADANITGQEAERVIEALWHVINEFHVKVTGEEFKREPDYTGADIAALHAFYLSHVDASNQHPSTSGRACYSRSGDESFENENVEGA